MEKLFNNSYKKSNKLIKAIVSLGALVIGSIFLATVINADTGSMPTWNGDASGGMPTFSVGSSETGYFPQSNGKGTVVFCNDQSSMVRSGSKDYEIYYPDLYAYGDAVYDGISSEAIKQTFEMNASHKKGEVYSEIEEGLSDTQKLHRDKEYKDGQLVSKDPEYPTDIHVVWDESIGEPENADETAPFILHVFGWTGDIEDMVARADTVLKYGLEDVFNEITDVEKPEDLQEGYDSEISDYPYTVEDINGVKAGPQVAVMGNQDTSTYTRYNTTTIDTRTTTTYKDIVNAYILTGEFHFGRQNPTPYNLLDVQVASWLHNDDNHNVGNSTSLPHGYLTNDDGTITTSETLTQGSGTRGEELYQEARQYYAFLTEVKEAGGYIATVNAEDTQVFASRDDGERNNDEYIIGPISITYPYYHNISYLTDIILETSNDDGDSATLSYANSDFSIVMETQGNSQLTGGTAFPGENGKDDEIFYIIVNASKAAYPDTINIKAKFEYTDFCKTKYTVLKTPGSDDGSNLIDIWRYIGVANWGKIPYTVKYFYVIESSSTKEDTSKWIWTNVSDTSNDRYPIGSTIEQETSPGPGWSQGGHPTTTVTTYENKEGTFDLDNRVLQGMVRMDTEDEYGTLVQDVAQELISIPYVNTNSFYNYTIPEINVTPDEPESSLETYAHKATAEAESEIEFRIKLGGKVWVDGTSGKESTYNGQANDEQDTPMSNVRVILHQRKPDGSESVKAETRTDGNGDYLFENLNALYTYYVEFVYNGQYYQPTTYKKDGVSWDNSSKGVDIISDRQNFNAKFEEIGSYQDNYAGGPVYTREDLEEAGLIDKFGNPTGNSNQYVNDCMISSYTGYNQNGTFHRDYYPVYTKFLVDEAFNGANKASIVTDTSGKSISTYDLPYRGDYNNLRVNQGYVLREIADLALQKDVLHTTLEMNDKLPQVYEYNKNNDSEAFDIEIRMEDYYYGTHYTRELYKEDYYKALDTNPLTQLDVDDLLKVYVTYKIRIRNQSEVIGMTPMEIVDYYDDEYTLIGSDNTVESEQKYKPYIGDRNGEPIEGATAVTTNDTSKYGTSTQKTIDGYLTTYIRTDSEVELQPGEDVFIYITLRVNSVNNLLILDDAEEDRGKANIAEINGYKTYYTEQSIAPNAGSSKTTQEYQDGDIAGLVDTDSIPGNIKTDTIDKNTDFEDIPESVTSNLDPNDPNYAVLKNQAEARWLRDTYGLEDDTDKAPSIKIILYTDPEATRTIEGTVFEDSRTEDAELAHIGNGMFDSGEPGVSNVRVDLIDLKQTEANGGTEVIAQILNPDTLEWADATTYTDGSGNYEFRGYIPSNYYVKYTYGIEEQKDAEGKIFYNGQDFKTTNYHTPVSEATGDSYLDNMYTVAYDVNNPDTTDYFYNLAKAEADNDAGLRYSDARDLMGAIGTTGTRLEVNDYSNNRGNGVTNALAQKLKDTTSETYMIAHSGQLNIEIEYDRSDTGTSDTGSDNLGTDNYDKSGYYHLINFDLGLVERPKAQIKITKQITNVRVQLRNDNILFDASDTATNVLWIDHQAHGPDTENTYEIANNYTDQMMQVPVVRANSSNKGRIQLTMDEELMQGATIQITYAITAANIGEVDYNNNEFYYYGTNTDFDTIVRTRPNVIIDYVGTQVHDLADDNSSTRNNLQFIAEQNPDWTVISIDDIIANDFLNASLRDRAELYNVIIQSTALSRDLLPIIADEASAQEIDNAFEDDPLNALDVVNNTQSVAGVQLILSETISPDNESDDLVYNNMVELVSSNNTVGRRMAYSVVGNQDPTVEPQEIDADDSQEVTILPPFGQQYIYYILGVAVAVILIGGIIGVIMVVRKRRK